MELSTEEKFILLICKAFLRTDTENELSAFVLREKIHWKTAFDKIQEHKLEQIAFFTFKRLGIGKHFKGIMNQIRPIIQVKTERSRALYNEQARVLARFKKENIPVYPYKGVIIAHTYYPTYRLRDSVDIDLAISEDHLEQSMTIMPELGYELINESRSTTDVKKMRSYDIDFSWIINDKDGKMQFNTEFHWQPSHSVLWVPLTFKDIISQTQEYQIFNQEVKSFHSPLHIVIVLTHHGLVDGWGKIRHLIDFAQIIKNTSEAEMKEVINLAKKYRLHNTLQVGVAIIEKLFEFKVSHISYSASMSKLADEMIPKIMQGEIVAKWSEQKIKLKYYLRMRDSLGDQIKSIFKLVSFALTEKKTKWLG